MSCGACSPGTLHSVRPFAIAGTSAKVYGSSVQFVTPPSGEPAAATPIPAAITPPPRAAAVLGILRAPDSVRRGRTLRLVVLGTEGGRAELVARRNGNAVRRISRSVGSGRFGMSWKLSRTLARGRYRVTVSVRTADGRTASDTITVRVVR